MKKDIMQIQIDVLNKCKEKGLFKLQSKKHSRINHAAMLAVKAGLMKKCGDNLLLLTKSGESKVETK